MERRTRGWIGGDVGLGGWVRSKPVAVECSQKFLLLPMMALRWGVEVVVDAIGRVEGDCALDEGAGVDGN